MHIIAIVVLLFLACGCDKHSQIGSSYPTSEPTTSRFDWASHWATGTTSTNLVRLIAEADRIVVTNRLASGIDAYRGFSLTLSGHEASDIVKDVSSMVAFSSTKPPTARSNSIFDWELRFYHGTNYLTAIYLDGTTFEFDGDEYGGDTGALKALSDRLLKLTTPPQYR